MSFSLRVLVDVGNNIRKTTEPFLPFEVAPIAIGQSTNAAAGEPVPAVSTVPKASTFLFAIT